LVRAIETTFTHFVEYEIECNVLNWGRELHCSGHGSQYSTPIPNGDGPFNGRAAAPTFGSSPTD
jgi:hypothetical protein